MLDRKKTFSFIIVYAVLKYLFKKLLTKRKNITYLQNRF